MILILALLHNLCSFVCNICVSYSFTQDLALENIYIHLHDDSDV